MDKKSPPQVVKQKIISSSKLQSIKVKPPAGVSALTNLASLESDIASISFVRNTPSVQTSKQKFSNELNVSRHHFSSSFEKSLQSERFNPFDRCDESNDSSSSSNSDLKSAIISESPNVGLAELGLAEDHFSLREGSLGLSSVEELKVAIENCKTMIINSPENSKKRKKLVENLVDLKIKLQEIKDSPNQQNASVKSILGHQLRKRKSRILKALCECCRSSLWSLMQVWYECKECSFMCHEKCIDSIRRTCVAKIAKTASYEYSICPEFGLSKQMYCCVECKNPIALVTGSNEGHLCDYTGYYYCSNCHWDDLMVIPARVLHNWDHAPQLVCRQSFQLLNMMFRKPVLNIEQINPMLFNYVEELGEIKRMREDIIKMKQYFLTCTAALEAKLLRKLSDRQHFIDNSHMYSMEDLVQTQSGVLTDDLVKIHGLYAKHIKLDCMVCQGKGFICEICNSGEALFPFDMMVSICSKCSAVFHSDCFSFIDKSCPRCKRKFKKRKVSMSYICGDEKLSSSDDDDIREPSPLTISDPEPLVQSPYSSWLTSKIKQTREEQKNRADSGFSFVSEAESGKNPFLSDREELSDLALISTMTSHDQHVPAVKTNCDLIQRNDVKNPFATENLEDGNPFLNDVYDSSKNPFCCN